MCKLRNIVSLTSHLLLSALSPQNHKWGDSVLNM